MTEVGIRRLLPKTSSLGHCHKITTDSMLSTLLVAIFGALLHIWQQSTSFITSCLCLMEKLRLWWGGKGTKQDGEEWHVPDPTPHFASLPWTPFSSILCPLPSWHTSKETHCTAGGANPLLLPHLLLIPLPLQNTMHLLLVQLHQ